MIVCSSAGSKCEPVYPRKGGMKHLGKSEDTI